MSESSGNSFLSLLLSLPWTMGFSPVVGQTWEKLQHQTEVGLLACKLSLQKKAAGRQSSLMFQIYRAIGCSMVSCKTGHKPFLARRKEQHGEVHVDWGITATPFCPGQQSRVLTHCTITLRDSHFLPCRGTAGFWTGTRLLPFFMRTAEPDPQLPLLSFIPSHPARWSQESRDLP